MTIDEAIKHAEEVAEDKERNAGWFYDKERSCYRKKCIKCAEEHRQLAEWLKNYKRLLEQQPCEDMVSLGVFKQVMWERDVAIEQLKELGYGLGEKIRTDGDTISRQKTIEAFEKWICSDYKDDYPIMSFIGIQTILEEQPSVKPQEPKTGHWIRVTDKSGHLVWECDKCGWQQRFNTNFCPDCGAKND